MHFFCRAIGLSGPNGEQIELITRFGRLQAIHVRQDDGTWQCMKGNSMHFYLKTIGVIGVIE